MLAVCRGCGDTNRDCHPGRNQVRHCRARRHAEALGKCESTVLVTVRDEEAEFLTSEADGNVTIASDLTYDRSKTLEHTISGVMAVPVVDVFEVIDIAEQNGEPSRCAKQADLARCGCAGL